MFHPTRGGTRGGRDQFSWEDVKNDKHRENYLGHSLMAPVGRWQKGKDLTWYAKETADDTKTKAKIDELARIKEAEAEAMAIALGVRKKKTLESHVTEDDLKQALNKDDDSDDGQTVDATEKGLGFGKSSRLPPGATGSNAVEVMNNSNRSFAPLTSSTESNTRDHSDDRLKKKKKHKKSHKHKSSKKKHHRHHSDNDSEEEESSSKRHRSHRDDHSRSRHHRSSEDYRSRKRSHSPDDRTYRSRGRDDRDRSPRKYDRPSHRYDDDHRSSRYRDERDRSPSPYRSHRREEAKRRSRSPSPVKKERSLSPYSKRQMLSKPQ